MSTEIETPATPFAIKKAADRDKMKPFRDTVALMDEGDAVEGVTVADAAKLSKAIEEKFGERTARVELNADDSALRNVIRVAPKPKKERKPRTKKAAE